MTRFLHVVYTITKPGRKAFALLLHQCCANDSVFVGLSSGSAVGRAKNESWRARGAVYLWAYWRASREELESVREYRKCRKRYEKRRKIGVK